MSLFKEASKFLKSLSLCSEEWGPQRTSLVSTSKKLASSSTHWLFANKNEDNGPHLAHPCCACVSSKELAGSSSHGLFASKNGGSKRPRLAHPCCACVFLFKDAGKFFNSLSFCKQEWGPHRTSPVSSAKKLASSSNHCLFANKNEGPNAPHLAHPRGRVCVCVCVCVCACVSSNKLAISTRHWVLQARVGVPRNFTWHILGVCACLFQRS